MITTSPLTSFFKRFTDKPKPDDTEASRDQDPVTAAKERWSRLHAPKPPYAHVRGTLNGILKGAEKKLLSNEEVETLRKFQEKIGEFHSELAKHGHGAAKQEMEELRAAYLANPTPENLEKFRGSETDIQKLTAKHETMRSTIKTAMRSFSEEVAAFVKPMKERFVVALLKQYEIAKKEEAALAAKYGFEEAPGRISSGIENLAEQIYNEDISAAAPFGFLGAVFESKPKKA